MSYPFLVQIIDLYTFSSGVSNKLRNCDLAHEKPQVCIGETAIPFMVAKVAVLFGVTATPPKNHVVCPGVSPSLPPALGTGIGITVGPLFGTDIGVTFGGPPPDAGGFELFGGGGRDVTTAALVFGERDAVTVMGEGGGAFCVTWIVCVTKGGGGGDAGAACADVLGAVAGAGLGRPLSDESGGIGMIGGVPCPVTKVGAAPGETSIDAACDAAFEAAMVAAFG
jgi:hypothetical protein